MSTVGCALLTCYLPIWPGDIDQLPSVGPGQVLADTRLATSGGMTEATGIEAKTIHRLLEVDPRTGGCRTAFTGAERDEFDIKNACSLIARCDQASCILSARSTSHHPHLPSSAPGVVSRNK
jgi:hypothetical protein